MSPHVRVERLDRLMDLLVRSTALALETGDWARLEVLDVRSLNVSSALDGARKRADAYVGFSPFAKAHMLNDMGYAVDTEHRVYVMGGNANGRRVRRESRGPLRVVWVSYAAMPDCTHLWVKWNDGTRRLVHRKGH